MYKKAFKKYLDDLAGAQAAPGGGSAAALVAACGVSLISMVANFTIGKEKYQAVQDEVKEVLASSEDLRQRLMVLVDQDVCAYQKVSRAYSLPKDAAGDKAKRTQAIQAALKEALAVPLEISRLSHQAIKLCPTIAQKGNPNLISDAGVAAEFLHSAHQAALLNVKINLKGIKDETFILGIRKIIEPMEKEVATIKEDVVQEVKIRGIK